jgi:hypothetical protein
VRDALAYVLARQGDENGLRALAERGARDAQHKLALLLGKGPRSVS